MITLPDDGPTAGRPGCVEVVFVDLLANADLIDAAERNVVRLSVRDRAHVQSLADDPERQRSWRLLRIATRIVLERAAGTAFRNVDFEIEKNGRPGFGGQPPYFNVSHSGGAALIAVSNVAAVGIDLEQARTLQMTEDRRCRVVRAAARLGGDPQPKANAVTDAGVLEAWVRLEAAAKALGTGIGQLLTEEGVVGGERGCEGATTSRLEIKSLDAPRGYVAAVASTSLPPSLEILAFPSEAKALVEFLAVAGK